MNSRNTSDRLEDHINSFNSYIRKLLQYRGRQNNGLLLLTIINKLIGKKNNHICNHEE